MWADMGNSASFFISWSCSVEVRGAHDSVSAVLRFFLGTWWMLYMNQYLCGVEIKEFAETNSWAVCLRRKRVVSGLSLRWLLFQQCDEGGSCIPKWLPEPLFQTGLNWALYCSLSMKHTLQICTVCLLLHAWAHCLQVRGGCICWNYGACLTSWRARVVLWIGLSVSYLLEWRLLSGEGPMPILNCCWGALSVVVWG